MESQKAQKKSQKAVEKRLRERCDELERANRANRANRSNRANKLARTNAAVGTELQNIVAPTVGITVERQEPAPKITPRQYKEEMSTNEIRQQSEKLHERMSEYCIALGKNSIEWCVIKDFFSLFLTIFTGMPRLDKIQVIWIFMCFEWTRRCTAVRRS